MTREEKIVADIKAKMLDADAALVEIAVLKCASLDQLRDELMKIVTSMRALRDEFRARLDVEDLRRN